MPVPRWRSRLMEHQFLYSKIGKLTDKESVFAAAVDGVNRPEFLEQPAGTAKFAEDGSVQAHPVYLTGAIDIVPRIGIGNIEDGVGSLGDTHRLCVAEVRKCCLEDAVVIKYLNAFVAAIAGVDVALRVHCNAQNISELAGSCASFAPGLHEFAVLIELGDTPLPAPSATKILPAASQATSVGRLKRSVGCPAPSPPGVRGGMNSDSALRPSSIATPPSGSNFMTMLLISSTAQTLSEGSTRTWAAVMNPYVSLPISRTYLPVRSNWNIRELPCAKGRMVPMVTVGCPVRV